MHFGARCLYNDLRFREGGVALWKADGVLALSMALPFLPGKPRACAWSYTLDTIVGDARRTSIQGSRDSTDERIDPELQWERSVMASDSLHQDAALV